MSETEKYAKAVHIASLASVVIAPILALLPPRKLDFYTLGLGVLTTYSANRLYRESYGRSLWDVDALRRIRTAGGTGGELPTDTAREFQARYMADRERLNAQAGLSSEEKERRSRSVLEKAWYGNETQGWKERREREVQDKLAEGKGYGGIITDQIWEVWNWGKGSSSNDTKRPDDK